MNDIRYIHWIAVALLASSAAVLSAMVAERDVLPRIRLGMRGMRRTKALHEHGLFAVLEPSVRWGAAWSARLPLNKQRATLTRYLRETGDGLGVSADELIALTTITTLITTTMGVAIGVALESNLAVVAGALFGPYSIAASLRARRQQRLVEVDRGLPAVIDLASLCVGAGLDLPSALQLVVNEGGARGGVLRDELRTVLRELALGRTRAQALSGFGERVPTRSVHDFVSAVVQAEEKGTPLSEALRIQASVLRGRRSVLAEEAAARAGVWMMLPLLLLLGCVMLVAMGGMVIRGMESGL